MLHDHVEIIVRYKVLQNAHGARVIFVLKRHGALNLHHDTLFELGSTQLEVFKLLDEEQCLRALILSNVGFNRWQKFLDCIWLQLRLTCDLGDVQALSRLC